jgi:hypothetical protein
MNAHRSLSCRNNRDLLGGADLHLVHVEPAYRGKLSLCQAARRRYCTCNWGTCRFVSASILYTISLIVVTSGGLNTSVYADCLDGLTLRSMSICLEIAHPKSASFATIWPRRGPSFTRVMRMLAGLISRKVNFARTYRDWPHQDPQTFLRTLTYHGG